MSGMYVSLLFFKSRCERSQQLAATKDQRQRRGDFLPLLDTKDADAVSLSGKITSSTMLRQARRSLRRKDVSSIWNAPLFTLLIGTIVGSIVTYIVLLPVEPTESSLRYASALSLAAPTPSEGWHPVHVFYGKKEGLNLDPSKEWYSQVHQDAAVIDLLGDNGYFIDLAANHAWDLSNSIALEKHGWNGLCIEPNPGYWYGLSHRKCTVVGALVGGPEVQKVSVKFRGVYGGILGRMDEKMANRKKEPDADTEDRYTVPFPSLLEEYKVPRTIDYMSLDVEGAEYLVMQHFPFDTYTIKIVTIERPSKELKELLEKHGYIMLKSLAWWGETLWAHKSTGFTPTHPKIVKIPTDERK